MKFPTNKKNTTFLEGLQAQPMVAETEWFVYTLNIDDEPDYTFFETCDEAMNYYRRVMQMYGYSEIISGSAFKTPSGKILVQINKKCVNKMYNMDVITLS